MWRKNINVISLRFQKSCDTVQQKQDTDSPMSNKLHYILYIIQALFAYDVSVYKHFSLFFNQHHHKI